MQKGKSRQKKRHRREYSKKLPEQTSIVKTVQRFSKRGAYVYIPNKWIGKRVRITLIEDYTTGDAEDIVE